MPEPKLVHSLLATRLALTAREAAQLLGLHRGTVRGLVRSGKLKAVMIGSRPKITTQSLRALVDAEPER